MVVGIVWGLAGILLLIIVVVCVGIWRRNQSGKKEYGDRIRVRGGVPVQGNIADLIYYTTLRSGRRLPDTIMAEGMAAKNKNGKKEK